MEPRSSLASQRNVLLADAATCVACGALLSIGAGLLAPMLALPDALLRYAGLSLFPVAAFIAFTALRAPKSPLVWLVVAGNALWVLGSLWVALGSAFAPNALGVAFVLAQAAVVAVLSVMEARSAPSLASDAPSEASSSR